jgi:2'-5' RNA ligase
VLWLGVEGDVAPLRLVQAWIEHKTVGFGGAPDERAFTPHLTLGRTPPHLQPNESRAVGESLEKLTGLERVSWPAAHYELIQSELRKTGAIHHTLQQFPLPESASCGLRE